MTKGLDQILQHSSDMYPGKIMLDSSKSTQFLKDFYLSEKMKRNLDIKVLSLSRDFRGWITSVLKYRKRAGMFGWWHTNKLLNAYRWLYTTIRWKYKLNQWSVPVQPVFYENLIFDMETSLDQIYQFLEINDAVTKLQPLEAHELYGSPAMKENSDRMYQVIYDPAWMNDLYFNIFGILLSPVYIYNAYLAKSI